VVKITFHKKKHIYGFEADGHANFDIEGKDIVCAAVSILLQSSFLGLTKILHLKNKNKIKKGHISFFLLEGLNPQDIEKSQIILKTLFESLKHLAKQYPKHIKINIRD